MAAPKVMNLPTAVTPPVVDQTASAPPPVTPPPAAAIAVPIAAIEAAAAAPPRSAEGLLTDQSNTPTVLMGVTGSGKSAQLAALALYVWQKFGKKTLIASFDGGGIPAVVQELIAVGIVVWWKPRSRDPYNNLRLTWDTIIKAFQGWYPQQVNPITGMMPAGGKLMPPIATVYHVKCPQGHLLQVATRQKDIVARACPACGTLTNGMNMVIDTASKQPEFFAQIGAVCIDSISQALSWGEDDLSERAGSSELGGMDGAIGGKIISGDQALGQTTMSHVGFVQQQAKSLCLMAGAIPNLVVPPVITALTMVANTKDGDRVCGMQLSGKAKTAEAGAWVGNCLEVEKVDVGRNQAGEPLYRHRMYLGQWKDDRGIIHLCKNRAVPGALPQWLQDPPATGDPKKDRDLAFSVCSLGNFFDILDASLASGITAKLTEYGGAAVRNELQSFEDPFAGMIEAPAGQVGPNPPVQRVAAAPVATGSQGPRVMHVVPVVPVVVEQPPAAVAPAKPKAAPKATSTPAPVAPVPAAATPTPAAAAPAAVVVPAPPAPPTIAAPPGRPKPPQAAPRPA